MYRFYSIIIDMNKAEMVCKKCGTMWRFVKNGFSREKQRYKCECWFNQTVANYYDNPLPPVIKIIALMYYTIWLETNDIAKKLWVSNSTVKYRLHEFWDFYQNAKSARNLNRDSYNTKIITWVLPSQKILDEILLHKSKKSVNLYLNIWKELLYFSQDIRVLKHLFS